MRACSGKLRLALQAVYLAHGRAGYGSETRLLDVDQGVSSRQRGCWRPRLHAHSTVWGGDAVP
jgi:hypothetical protein